MLSNSITLVVDEDNVPGTAGVSKTFTRFEEFQNRSVYIETAHSIAMKDTLSFYRTLPKISGNFRGSAKCAFKFTKDYEVPGVDSETVNLVPAIVEGNLSLPVGLTPAQVMALYMRVNALLGSDAIMVPLTTQLMI